MVNIRESILNCLEEFSINDDKLIYELNLIAEKGGLETFSSLFSILTHIQLQPDVAKNHWQQIILHRESLQLSLGRTVSLRTAICDYFCSINKCFKNPMIVEFNVVDSFKSDSVTGLMNRKSFEELFIREIARAQRHGTELSILFLDLDNFKKINDTYGHLAGDRVLKHISQIIKSEIRKEDIAARFGGEEFVILMPETKKIAAFVLGERIRRKIETTRINYENQSIHLTISGGLAAYPKDAKNTISLLRCADNAAYKAKEIGKNTIVIYTYKKRRFIRIDFVSDTQVQIIGYNGVLNSFRGKSKNLSVGGLLFECSQYLDIGTKLRLKINMNSLNTPLEIIGTVVRVEEFDQNKFDIGISFLGLEKKPQNEISQYITQFCSQS